MNKEQVEEVVSLANRYISSKLWFDFDVTEFHLFQIAVSGGIDLHVPSGHELEIWFDQVFFFSGLMSWHTDTALTSLHLVSGAQARSLNKKFEVEKGHHIFRFSAEGYPDDFGCFIGAREIRLTKGPRYNAETHII